MKETKGNPYRHIIRLMAIAIAFSLLGVGIFLATNNPFSMLSLSDQYAAATTDAQKTTLLAAGQAVLTNTSQRIVGGFNVGLFLVSVAGLIASSVMLKSSSFSRSTAYVGIAAWALSLVDYLRQIVTQSATIALLVIVPHTLLLIVKLGDHALVNVSTFYQVPIDKLNTLAVDVAVRG